jgi:hypothetical protein
MKSHSPIHGIIEEKGKFLVAFSKHDGYFHADDERVRKALLDAHRENREVSFTFDPTLKILSIE